MAYWALRWLAIRSVLVSVCTSKEIEGRTVVRPPFPTYRVLLWMYILFCFWSTVCLRVFLLKMFSQVKWFCWFIVIKSFKFLLNVLYGVSDAESEFHVCSLAIVQKKTQKTFFGTKTAPMNWTILFLCYRWAHVWTD